ncbi:extracellular solute-binding protein [Alkalihalobacillus sp. 1P02AB]|uniref:extracellular solute-binding protein n=1 Tax=Alkalihalobacillus sp. 1P02AB TaxID=3132260 RepID=UPI0039A4339D
MLMKKKGFLLFVATLMTVLILAACSGDSVDNEPEEPADEPGTEEGTGETAESEGDAWVLGSEQLDITVFGNYDWYTMDQWGADEATANIQELYDVHLTAIDGGGNAAQRLSTMIVDGNLPDIIWTDRGADVERLREGGVLVAFDDYLDKYPNLKTWMSEEAMNLLRSEDGKLYQFPNWYNDQPFGNGGYLVHKGIYEELGSPSLETTDDLYEYLKLVQAEFPDVIPFETGVEAQGVGVLYSAFAEGRAPTDIRNQGVPNGDKLVSLFEDENYVDSLKYASKLFRERLMTQDALTQSADDLEEKILNGRVAVFAGASVTTLGQRGHQQLIADDPDSGYFVANPIHKEGNNPNNTFPGDYNQLGWNVNVITTSAEDPEKVFAFLDWLTGPEGQMLSMFGPEGVYWDGWIEEGVLPNFTDAYINDQEGAKEMEGGAASFQFNGNSKFLDNAKGSYEMQLPEDQITWTTYWQQEVLWPSQLDVTEFLNINPMPESDEGIAQQRIGEIFEEARAKALYAQSDEEVEQIVADANEQAMAVGYQQVLDYKTTKWQENLAAMQGN